MSKPDPTGGSLEDILASIRRSLSEQSTDALIQEEAAVPVDAQKDAKSAVARREGLTQRLADTTADPPQADKVEPREDDLSDLLEDRPPSAPSPSPAAASSPTGASAPSEMDPLWFLSRQGEPAAGESEQPLSAGASQPASIGGKTPVAEPKLPRPAALRGSLPPFFGSKAEATPAEPISPGVGVVQPPGTTTRGPEGEPAMAAVRTTGPETARKASLQAVAAADAAAAGGHQSAAAAEHATRNGRANSFVGPAAVAEARTTPGGDTPNTHALEVVVSELLRPMLRQWLDQNMPRLVSAALKDEIARAAATGRDAKKT